MDQPVKVRGVIKEHLKEHVHAPKECPAKPAK